MIVAQTPLGRSGSATLFDQTPSSGAYHIIVSPLIDSGLTSPYRRPTCRNQSLLIHPSLTTSRTRHSRAYPDPSQIDSQQLG
jgi:hypothetical protein